MPANLPMEWGNAKFEARNPKFETNLNVSNPKDFFICFELWNFEFVSDFDIRISDFSQHLFGVPSLPDQESNFIYFSSQPSTKKPPGR